MEKIVNYLEFNLELIQREVLRQLLRLLKNKKGAISKIEDTVAFSGERGSYKYIQENRWAFKLSKRRL